MKRYVITGTWTPKGEKNIDKGLYCHTNSI